ncbi:hypothetical protein E2C01_078845 [Portunus trituberculatus]|uniref:Uncharacterized protein n=1 Tax=Portunus trituberculatus TaxID=210409 RepID=A0A5B7ITW3_PORTR|nr:hypothetical protein [Portunus trituberculatus]
MHSNTRKMKSEAADLTVIDGWRSRVGELDGERNEATLPSSADLIELETFATHIRLQIGVPVCSNEI